MNRRLWLLVRGGALVRDWRRGRRHRGLDWLAVAVRQRGRRGVCGAAALQFREARVSWRTKWRRRGCHVLLARAASDTLIAMTAVAAAGVEAEEVETVYDVGNERERTLATQAAIGASEAE